MDVEEANSSVVLLKLYLEAINVRGLCFFYVKSLGSVNGPGSAA